MLPVLPLMELDCWLMMTSAPAGSVIVWLGCPETAIVWPLMTRSAISELPLTAGPPVVQTAMALDRRKLAAMVLPPAVRVTSATEASERARSAWPMVDAWATSAVSSPGKLIDSSEVCRAPPEGGSGPVSDTVVLVMPSAVTRSTVAWPLNATAGCVQAKSPGGQTIKAVSTELSTTRLQVSEILSFMVTPSEEIGLERGVGMPQNWYEIYPL